MLYQDTLTGYLYEVPETQLAQGGQVMYDGLGNPLGFPPIFAALGPIASAILPAVAPMLTQAAGGLLSRFLSPSGPPSAPVAPGGAPAPGGPGLPGIMSAIMPTVMSLVSRLLASRGSTMGELPASYQQVGELPTESLAEYYNPYGYSSWSQQPMSQGWYQQPGSQWGYQQSPYQSWGYPSWYRRY